MLTEENLSLELIHYIDPYTNEECIEQFKPIKGYEGLYEISDCGRAKSMDRITTMPHGGIRNDGKRILKYSRDQRGYKLVGLNNRNFTKSFRVHILVWDNFSELVRNGRILQVDHINNDKSNNCFYNLQLLTQRENISKSKILLNNKSSQYTGVSWDKSRNKWAGQININKKHIFLGRYDDEYLASIAYETKKQEILNQDLI